MENYIIRQPINKVKRFGEVFSVNGQELKWRYEPNGDGTITITGIDFTEFSEQIEARSYDVKINLAIETLVIPSQIEGKTVVGINWKDSIVTKYPTLDQRDGILVAGIKTVIFADTIKKIEAKTKYGNENIIFPDVENIHLSNNLEIVGKEAFRLNDEENKLSRIDIPQSVSEIGESAFLVRDNLTINFPNGKNEALEISEDKWGARETSKIIISGVEYTN